MTDPQQRRREQIAFEYRQGTQHRNVQKLPLRTNHEADNTYAGHQAGIHPEHQPYVSEDLTQSRTGRNAPLNSDYQLEEDDSYYITRPHTSSRRYNGSPVATRQSAVNAQVYRQGNRIFRYRGDLSQRPQLPPQHEIHREEYEVVSQRGRRLHPLVWLGLFIILLTLGWIGLNLVTSWYQEVQTDWTYGKQRHFEIDAVVGHNDSQTNPSHFTAENNGGEIIVIELPGGDVSKAKIYQVETIPGNINNPPVKLSFQDVNGDGKPDMLVQVGNGSDIFNVVLYNNGTQFVSKL
jgi:hypothetical protein